MFGVNGTAVQQGITLGPYSINFDGYSFGGAGGWAFWRAVTRLEVHWSTPPPQSNANIATLHPLWMVDPRYATALGAGGGQAEASQDSPTECNNSESVSAAG